MTGHIYTSDLYRVLTEASLFACTDTERQTINVVRLESDGTNLLAVGTDRFALGCSQAAWVQDKGGAPFAISLPLEQVHLLRSMLKPSRRRTVRRGVAEVRVTPKATRLYVKLDTASLLVAGLKPDAKFPEWRKLLPASAVDEKVPAVWGMDPTKLARFNQIDRHTGARFYSSGPAKALCVAIGDDFVGLVMPYRLPEGTEGIWTVPDWVFPS